MEITAFCVWYLTSWKVFHIFCLFILFCFFACFRWAGKFSPSFFILVRSVSYLDNLYKISRKGERISCLDLCAHLKWINWLFWGIFCCSVNLHGPLLYWYVCHSFLLYYTEMHCFGAFQENGSPQNRKAQCWIRERDWWVYQEISVFGFEYQSNKFSCNLIIIIRHLGILSRKLNGTSSFVCLGNSIVNEWELELQCQIASGFISRLCHLALGKLLVRLLQQVGVMRIESKG